MTTIFIIFINFNLVISVDVMGMSGENQDAITDDVFKQQLNEAGEVINGTNVVKQGLIKLY